MKKIHKHIEIVRSGVGRYTSMGKKSCDMIQETLSKYYEHVGISVVDDVMDLEALIRKQPDLVFLGMKKLPTISSEYSEPVWLSSYLSDRGINYTGSTQPAIAMDFDKNVAKDYIHNMNLPTASFFTAVPGQYTSEKDLPLQFPLFVKPSSEGGGSGIDSNSVVHDFPSFVKKVKDISDRFQSPALVEHYLTGREFSVALLADPLTNDIMTMPIELIAAANQNGDRILGKDVKKEDSEQVVAVHPSEARDKVTQLAADVFRGLGARDYGRVDIRMDEHDNPYFLEANLVPGLIKRSSYFTKACAMNENIDYDAMLLRIVQIGLERGDERTASENDLLFSLENIIPSF